MTALSTILIFSPSVDASLVISVTLLFTYAILSILSCINFTVSVIDSIIFSDVSSRCESASIILLDDSFVPLLRFLISSATTAKPFPASPALAASIEALSARRFVWLEMLSIVPVSSFTLLKSALKSLSIFSTSFERTAILLVTSTTSFNSFSLVLACSTEAPISVSTSFIRSATSLTCVSITLVISTDEIVLSLRISLFEASVFMSFTTLSAPSLFSSASSLTTVTPSTMELLASLTCSTVFTTLARFALIEAVSAPSDSIRCLIELSVQKKQHRIIANCNAHSALDTKSIMPFAKPLYILLDIRTNKVIHIIDFIYFGSL